MTPKGDDVLSFHLGQVIVLGFKQGYQVPVITETSKSVSLRETVQRMTVPSQLRKVAMDENTHVLVRILQRHRTNLFIYVHICGRG